LFGIADAVKRARERWPARTVHVECERLDQVQEAVAAGVDAVMLDNMSTDEVRACVAVLRTGDPRCLIEVSGGIDLDTVAAYAATGVDLISVGAITSSAPTLDIGLDVSDGSDVVAGQ
jgi:nicotinate-nucleotide pyrophosphorylase (carboxylating)